LKNQRYISNFDNSEDLYAGICLMPVKSLDEFIIKKIKGDQNSELS